MTLALGLTAGAIVVVQLLVMIVLWWRLARLSRQMREAYRTHAERRDDVPASMLVTALSQLEQRLAQMERSKPLPSSPGASPDRSYQLAQRLARQGASAAQIAEACGISAEESELLLRLHAPQS